MTPPRTPNVTNARLDLGDAPERRTITDRDLLRVGERLAADIRFAQLRDQVCDEDTRPFELDARAGSRWSRIVDWLQRIIVW